MPQEDDENASIDEWLKESRARHESQLRNIQLLETAERLDEAKIRALDSTLKKTTAFMKKVKNIGTSISPVSLLPELDRLNVSKFLDEIASSICDAKIKTSELAALAEFCVRIASLYAVFPEVLLDELKKHVPHKKSDKVENPSKLRVDLRFLAELVLNGVLKKEGVQLLGSVLSYLVNTDKTEHVHLSILMPLCRSALFDLTGRVPLKHKHHLREPSTSSGLVSDVLSAQQKTAIANLLKDYFESLVKHVNDVRVDMNRLRKMIKRQERTKGDASADDRQKLDQLKATYDRLLQSSTELGECLGEAVPDMIEEPSDDELDELAAKKLDTDLTEGRMSLWPDRDMHNFYEVLADVVHLAPASKAGEDDFETADPHAEHVFAPQNVEESVDAVDVSNLERAESSDGEDAHDEEADEAADDEEYRLESEQDEYTSTLPQADASLQPHISLPVPSQNFNEFLSKLSNAINKQLIDAAAVEYVTSFDKKSNRKRLVNHLLAAPSDRLDLLPFYGRFIATVHPAIPDISLHVSHELLNKFREIASKPCQPVKKGDKKSANQVRIDVKVHLCKYISELVKFSILPKAEALSCLRPLLVDLRQYKVDMLCAMIESMGLYLYRSPETHPKMKVILDVMKKKSSEKIKDPRQKLLLDNAYFCVVPPEEESTPLSRRPPMQEFILMKIVNADERTDRILRRLDWSDESVAGFALKCLENPTSVGFDDLENLASLTSALSEYHDWIGVRVVDSVLEFLRLSLEANHPSLQQRTFSAVAYLGQLFNYNVCGTAVIFKVLYQLIAFGVWEIRSADDLVTRTHRIPLVYELVNAVCEFFCSGACKKRMDTFFDFFLRFYYETTEAWPRFEEQLGGIPRESGYAVEEMLNAWRRGEKFAKTLEEANERVQAIERQYKSKVDEIMEGMKTSQGAEADGMRRLNCILEEMDEEEEDFEEEYADQRGERIRRRCDDDDEHSVESEGEPSQHSPPADDGEEEEQIRVHTQRTVLPEDEDFMREFNRMMMESIQTAPPSLKAPMTDLEVPPSARQKFERKITFADSHADTNEPVAAVAQSRCPLTEGVSDSAAQDKEGSRLQMALMTRGKGNRTVLKAVKLETSQSMQNAWREYQQVRERERKEVKKLTLAHDERQQNDPAEEASAAATSTTAAVGSTGTGWH